MKPRSKTRRVSVFKMEVHALLKHAQVRKLCMEEAILLPPEQFEWTEHQHEGFSIVRRLLIDEQKRRS